jgi:hypothetical protein
MLTCYTICNGNNKASSRAITVSYTSIIISVGGRTSARRKPYKNDTRKPSNKARSKRIYKHKAIVECKQVTDKQLLNVEVIDYKYTSDIK